MVYTTQQTYNYRFSMICIILLTFSKIMNEILNETENARL
jgi:hypothetical protein